LELEFFGHKGFQHKVLPKEFTKLERIEPKRIEVILKLIPKGNKTGLITPFRGILETILIPKLGF